MLHKTFAGLLLSLILFSCKKGEQVDLSTLQTYHNFAIPLISAEIDVEDMLQSDTGDIISTGNNGELFIRTNLFSSSNFDSHLSDVISY